MKMAVKRRKTLVALLAVALFLTLQAAAVSGEDEWRPHKFPDWAYEGCAIKGVCLGTDDCSNCPVNCWCEGDEICNPELANKLNYECYIKYIEEAMEKKMSVFKLYEPDATCSRITRNTVDGWGCIKGDAQCGDGACSFKLGENCSSCKPDCACDRFWGEEAWEAGATCKPKDPGADTWGCSYAQMVIVAESLSVVADGESYIDFNVLVMQTSTLLGSAPIQVWIETNDPEWSGKLGQPEPGFGVSATVEGLLGAGIYEARYRPPAIKSFEPINAKIMAKHVVTGATAEADITITSTAFAGIGVLEPLQVLRHAALVAGKRMVVMVGIRTDDEKLFVKNGEYEAFLDFEITGDDFTPPAKFERIDLAENTDGKAVVRQTEVWDHLKFFQKTQSKWTKVKSLIGIEGAGEIDYAITEEPAGGKWLFYEFYVDPKNLDYEGDYTFSARLYIEKTDPVTGEKKTIELDKDSVAYKVFPSPVMRIRIMPIGIGLWNDDFCEFCVGPNIENIDRDPWMETLGRAAWKKFSYRMWGRPETGIKYDQVTGLDEEIVKMEGLDRMYKFNCSGNMFALTFDGVVDAGKIQKVFNKDDALMRAFCAQEFNKIFPPNELQGFIAKSPLKNSKGENDKILYLSRVEKSIEFFKGVMPVAEERIHFDVQDYPYQSPLFRPRMSAPWEIVTIMRNNAWPKPAKPEDKPQAAPGEFEYSALEYENIIGGGEAQATAAYYDRAVGLVPLGEYKSNLDFDDATGYMSSLLNDQVVLVAEYAEPHVMTHEIGHTYCAIDEYLTGLTGAAETARQTLLSVPTTCGEGWWRINSRPSVLGKDNGTKVENGYWVDKRQFRGTPDGPSLPGTPNYSYMGKGGTADRWTTDDLYFGMGVKLRTFPSIKEGAHGKRQD